MLKCRFVLGDACFNNSSYKVVLQGIRQQGALKPIYVTSNLFAVCLFFRFCKGIYKYGFHVENQLRQNGTQYMYIRRVPWCVHLIDIGIL